MKALGPRRITPPDRRLLGEGAWVAIGTLGAALGTLVGMRLLTEFVPPGVYGNVSLLMGLLTLGTNLFCTPQMQAAQRFYPELCRQGQLARLRATLARGLTRSTALLAGIFVFAGMVLALLTDVSASWFLVLAALLGIEAARSLEINLLTAARRQKAYGVWRTAENWTRPIIAVVVVSALGATPQVVLGSYFVASTGLYLLARAVLRPEGGAAAPDGALGREIRQYALPLVPLALVAWTHSLGDRYILAQLVDLRSVGLYAAIYSLMSAAFNLPLGILMVTLRPVYFDAVSARDRHSEERVFRTWIRTAIVLCALGIVGVAVLDDLLLALFLAEDYRGAPPIMPVLATGFSLMALSQIYNTTSLAYKKSRNVLYSESGAALMAVASGIPLIAWFGLWGAAAATAMAYLVQAALAYGLAKRRR